MNYKIIIFFPSREKATDRIEPAKNKEEWEAWNFRKNVKFVIRYSDKIKDLPTEKDLYCNSSYKVNNLIMWVNTNIINTSDKTAQILNEISNNFTEHYMYILKHGVDFNPNKFDLKERGQCVNYTLTDCSNNKKRWEEILLPLIDVKRDINELITNLIKEFFFDFQRLVYPEFFSLIIDLNGIKEIIDIQQTDTEAKVYYKESKIKEKIEKVKEKIEKIKEKIYAIQYDNIINKVTDIINNINGKLDSWDATKIFLKENFLSLLSSICLIWEKDYYEE